MNGVTILVRALDSGDCILVNDASWKRLFAARTNLRTFQN